MVKTPDTFLSSSLYYSLHDRCRIVKKGIEQRRANRATAIRALIWTAAKHTVSGNGDRLN